MDVGGQATGIDYNRLVARNLRGALYSERWTGRRLTADLGVTNNWLHRRITRQTPRGPNDIVKFSELLHLNVNGRMV